MIVEVSDVQKTDSFEKYVHGPILLINTLLISNVIPYIVYASSMHDHVTF